MPRVKQQVEVFTPGTYVRAKDSFSGDIDSGDRDEEGRPVMVPVVVTPASILEASDPIVRRWPHHFQALAPDRQRPAVEQATAAPGEVRA